MDDKTEFILNAANDTQGTIRAIDVKVGALLTGLLIPITFLGRIWNHLIHLSETTSPVIAMTIGSTFLIMWLLAVLMLVRTLSAIDNPASHIHKPDDCIGSFYGGGLFTLGPLDTIFNRKSIRSTKSLQEFLGEYPASTQEINRELAFEHLKLIYIRDIKLHRFKFALRLATIWLLLGLGAYLLSKYSLVN